MEYSERYEDGNLIVTITISEDEEDLEGLIALHQPESYSISYEHGSAIIELVNPAMTFQHLSTVTLRRPEEDGPNKLNPKDKNE